VDAISIAGFEPMFINGQWISAASSHARGQVVPTDHARLITLTREPIGVALIPPWNFPFMTAARKLAPAPAAGCSVVIEIGVAEGTTVEPAGGRLDRLGHFLAPTELGGLTTEMRVAQEEIVGPGRRADDLRRRGRGRADRRLDRVRPGRRTVDEPTWRAPRASPRPCGPELCG
jgi:hypothetical protein